LGGLEDSATGILSEMSKPLSWSMPALKICERLKKMDAQVCDIKYGMLVTMFISQMNETRNILMVSIN